MENTKEPSSTAIDLDQPLLKAGILNITGEIKNTNISQVILQILSHQELRTKHLTLYINSSGGSMNDAFALIDIMQLSPITFTTIAIGEVASAALLIFLAGDHRLITPNTSVLSHQFSWGTSEKYHELKAARVEEDNTLNRMLSIYHSATGLSHSAILQHLLTPSDVYLTSKQCVKYKIAHKIMACGKKTKKKKK